jgi:hypothetical protein
MLMLKTDRVGNPDPGGGGTSPLIPSSVRNPELGTGNLLTAFFP